MTRRLAPRLWELLAAGVVLAAGAGAMWGCERAAASRFPHRAHFAPSACGGPGEPECPSCIGCHDAIRVSEEHPTRPVSDCQRCHTPAERAVQAEVQRLAQAPARLRAVSFTHREHLSLPEIRSQCVQCHPGVVEDRVTGDAYPTMSSCLECHGDEFARGECAFCHPRADLHRRVPRTFLRHDQGFVRDHAGPATQHAQVCTQCHAQSYCTGCHDASQSLPVEHRRVGALDRQHQHQADFLSRHAIEARSRPARCLRCHEPSSCDGCHVARGVSAARVGSTSQHPRGWIGPDPTSPDYHGRRARRDIVSCAACHDHGPATNCIRCHRVGAYGGNPHPSGWSSARSEDDAMCRYCHSP